MDEIPEREQLIHTDRDLRASLERGLQQAAAGETAYRGSFAQYLPWWERWTRRGPLDVVRACLAAVAVAVFILDADARVSLLVAALAVVVVGVGEASLIRSHTRHANALADVAVLAAVRNDPGQCSTGYSRATGLKGPKVRKALARLVRTHELRTEKRRHLDELPLVDVHLPEDDDA